MRLTNRARPSFKANLLRFPANLRRNANRLDRRSEETEKDVGKL
jgi:hypothetical protein